MIDVHCHLEQNQYNGKLNDLIKKWKKQLKAIVTSCAAFSDLDKSLEIAENNKGFIFLSVGLHPTYIKELTEKQIQKTIEFIKKNKEKIVAIGEIGLDYHWVKDEKLREKQKELFIRFINLAKELDKPIVIHCWDAAEDTINVLEKEGMGNKKVLMHLFQDRKFIDKIIGNNWFVSVGPLIRTSKNLKKLVRDLPLKNILTETDSPWFSQPDQNKLGEPINVKVSLQEISKVKEIDEKTVEKTTDLNAIKFFNLNIN